MLDQQPTTFNRPPTVSRRAEQEGVVRQVWQTAAAMVTHPIESQLRASGDYRGRADTPAAAIAAAILSVPAAARTQLEINKQKSSRPGSPTNRGLAARMIQFHGSLVDCFEALPASALVSFRGTFFATAERVLGASSMFSRPDYDSIVDGVSREFAVEQALNAALPEDYVAGRSGVLGDLDGTDITITHEESGLSLGIDVKAHAAYAHAIGDLWRSGRISDEDYAAAQIDGYVYLLKNDRHNEKRLHCVFDADSVRGLSSDGLRYANPNLVAAPFVEYMDNLIAEKGQTAQQEVWLRKLGRHGVRN